MKFSTQLKHFLACHLLLIIDVSEDYDIKITSKVFLFDQQNIFGRKINGSLNYTDLVVMHP